MTGVEPGRQPARPGSARDAERERTEARIEHVERLRCRRGEAGGDGHGRSQDREHEDGDTHEELVERMTRLAFHVGWPSAMSAVTRANELFAKKETQ